MTKNEIPNEPGDYLIEGIKIIVLPKKILIDTGERRSRGTGGTANRDRDAYTDGNGRGGNGEKKGEKKHDWLNDLLDNAQDIVTGKKRA